MKTKLICLLLCCSQFLLHAADVDLRRHITVSATAEIQVAPDIVTWQIKIRGEAGTLVDATKKLDTSAKALNKALVNAEFRGDLLKLSAISSGRHYDTTGDTKIFKGFYVERTAMLDLRVLNKRQVLETILLSDDNIEIVQIQSSYSKHDEIRKKVLLKAAEVAKTKAKGLAEIMDAKLGVVLAVSQSDNRYGYASAYSNSRSTISSAAPTEQFEKLSYTTTVIAKFEIFNR